MEARSRNILILHGLGPKKYRLKGQEEVELMFYERNENYNYFIHDINVKLPNKLKSFNFDVIYITATFLVKLSHPNFHQIIDRDYAFLKSHKSTTIALPQDDYWCQETRDDWYTEYADLIVSVFDPIHWETLYPSFLKTKKPIIRGHTCYLSARLVNKIGTISSGCEKINDIVYRSTGKPSFPNKLGYIKYSLGSSFKEKLKETLALDISNEPKDVILGDDWYRFIASSKAILGSNSGSSTIIRNHSEMLRIKKIMIENPNLETLEIYENFIKKEDKHFQLTDISPRNIEAALCKTLQILIKGSYGGILKPGIDYVELEEDFSNIDHVVSILKHPNKTRTIIQNCYETIINNKELSMSNLDQRIEDFLRPRLLFKENSEGLNNLKKQLKLHYTTLNLFMNAKFYFFHLVRTRFPLKIYNLLGRAYFKI